DVLVARGVPANRIAMLNAETAKASADRQRIAEGFNGNPAEGIAPKYDVVIANAVAYEGIDLQTRTCAIHHIDLPWEPATLQQRNGRGVRQGNQLARIAIYYYFALRSMDALRFGLIQGKRGWMVALLKSQDRATNNPGASMDLGPDEILLLLSRDPEKTQERLAKMRARQLAEQRTKVATNAANLLRGALGRFRQARRVKTEDAIAAREMMADGEQRLDDLRQVDPAAWPWAHLAAAARTVEDMVIPMPEGLLEEGAVAPMPLFEGLRTRLDGEPVEWGRIWREDDAPLIQWIGMRKAGQTTWSSKAAPQIKPTSVTPIAAEEWPDESGLPPPGLPVRLHDWSDLSWWMASDDWLERTWRAHGPLVLRRLSTAGPYWSRDQRVPVITPRGELLITSGEGIGQGRVIPPTQEGWTTFADLIARGQLAGEAGKELRRAAQYWWRRKDLPRGPREKAPPIANRPSLRFESQSYPSTINDGRPAVPQVDDKIRVMLKGEERTARVTRLADNGVYAKVWNPKRRAYPKRATFIPSHDIVTPPKTSHSSGTRSNPTCPSCAKSRNNPSTPVADTQISDRVTVTGHGVILLDGRVIPKTAEESLMTRRALRKHVRGLTPAALEKRLSPNPRTRNNPGNPASGYQVVGMTKAGKVRFVKPAQTLKAARALEQEVPADCPFWQIQPAALRTGSTLQTFVRR
ncbi:MAG: hypothetical protein KC620_09950, partial [Myxococcales bacterium]|nr:hypothetical protein [Myxococcales bacterium]